MCKNSSTSSKIKGWMDGESMLGIAIEKECITPSDSRNEKLKIIVNLEVENLGQKEIQCYFVKANSGGNGGLVCVQKRTLRQQRCF